ncbi:MAG: glycosyltransferase family 2 protein [Candidatus Melainabacteria bacterium]|nr:glycosyltransferase family 2 protein [Candidatus Melainabacteria bacterium]
MERMLRVRLFLLLAISLLVIYWIEQKSPFQQEWLHPPATLFAVLIVVLYCGYLTAAFLNDKGKQWLVRWRKGQITHENTYWPSVSVIIPAYNEATVIESTVMMAMALDYPSYDVLVVDDNSRDATPEILASLSQRFATSGRFKVLTRRQEAAHGKSTVLNEALTHVAGEVIVVFDADGYVEPDFLRRTIPLLADEEVAGVQARKLISNAETNWWTRCQAYEYAFDAHIQSCRSLVQGATELRGNGQLVKRQALAAVGGWNEASVTDDLDLSTRLHMAGWDIQFAHDVTVWEEGITDFISLLRQRRRWAEGSLIRYLQFMGGVLFAGNVSVRTKIDLVVYLINFLFPLWLVLDYGVMLAGVFSGDPSLKTHMLLSLAMAPFLILLFMPTICVAIYRFTRPSISESIIGATFVSIYISLVWFPVVFWVVLKVLFRLGHPLKWDKTAHHGHASAETSLPTALPGSRSVG